VDRHTKIFLTLFIVLVTFSSFGAGLVLKSLLVQEQLPPLPEQPKPNIPSNPEISEMPTNYKFLPGKHYIEDTVILISKEEPHITVVATNVRLELDNGYLQNSRVSYFDGSKWHRKVESHNTKDSYMYSNDLIKKWETTIEPSRVLIESSTGEIVINEEPLEFSTGLINNEIGVRSLPGYTKFVSKGEGQLAVDNKIMPAHVLYSRVYSLNAKDIQFYDAPLGLTTVWAAFWDEENNLYYVDATEVKNPVPIYQTHKLAVIEGNAGTVTKTFDLNINFDNQADPKIFNISLNNPIQKNLTLNLQNSLNKSTQISQTWFFGQASGEVVDSTTGERKQGIGLVEFIKD
jgi:hypothetical protein